MQSDELQQHLTPINTREMLCNINELCQFLLLNNTIIQLQFTIFRHMRYKHNTRAQKWQATKTPGLLTST